MGRSRCGEEGGGIRGGMEKVEGCGWEVEDEVEEESKEGSEGNDRMKVGGVVLIECKKTFCSNLSGAPPYNACDKKCATMGPSMSVIIYIDHQLTSSLTFTSIPGVERRCSTQVV